jgi:hypothetical protein
MKWEKQKYVSTLQLLVLIGTAVPSVTQDITGTIGHYINTSGTVDILQVFPYVASDISKSSTSCTITVPTPASYCGTLAGATISADSTLISLLGTLNG